MRAGDGGVELQSHPVPPMPPPKTTTAPLLPCSRLFRACAKIKVCTRSPSSACSWSVSAPWATFSTRCLRSRRCGRRIPTWQIGWVVEPRWQALLQRPRDRSGHSAAAAAHAGCRPPALCRRPREWQAHPLSAKTLSEIRALRRELRAAGYDAVLDLQGAIRSAVIAPHDRMRAPHRRSQPARVAGALALYRARGHARRARDRAGCGAGLGRCGRRACSLLRRCCPSIPRPKAGATQLAAPPAGTRPAGADHSRRRLGRKALAGRALCRRRRGLSERGMRVLVNAGPGEEPLADAHLTATGGAAIPLTTSLRQLIALTRRIACASAETPGRFTWPARSAGRWWASTGPPIPAATGPTARVPRAAQPRQPPRSHAAARSRRRAC